MLERRLHTKRSCPILVLDVLYVTRSTTRRVDLGMSGGRGLVKDFRVMTLAASCFGKGTIDIYAHVSGFMTTTARQNLHAVFIRGSVDSMHRANVIEMDAVKLRIPPLVLIVLICTVFL